MDQKTSVERVEMNRGDKECGRCRQTLPVSMFSPNRQRRDKIHPYCKVCAREITRRYRKGLRNRIKSYGKSVERKPNSIWKPRPPLERVLNACRTPKTQSQIKREAEVEWDELSDILAELIVVQGAVRQREVNEERVYFVR